MPLPYAHADLERSWQQRWAADRLYDVDVVGDAAVDPTAKLYNLVEFPYPSAEGLQIGHVLTYCGADVWGRFQRRCGRVVFQPIGFDGFGINAENYAASRSKAPNGPDGPTTSSVAIVNAAPPPWSSGSCDSGSCASRRTPIASKRAWARWTGPSRRRTASERGSASCTTG